MSFGGVDSFADDLEVEFFGRTDVLARRAIRFVFDRHSKFFCTARVFAPSGLGLLTSTGVATAPKGGMFLRPLRHR